MAGRVDPGLRRAVLKATKVSPQAIYDRVKTLRRKLGALSTSDGWGLVAALEGIDVSKHLGAEDVARVRDLVGRVKQSSGNSQPDTRTARKRGSPRTVHVTIAPSSEAADRLLPGAVAAEAAVMAEHVYPRVYVLENSIRNFILRIMGAAHGKDWWDTHAPASIRKTVAGRMRSEERTHWHGKRNVHPIYFSDFPHLADMIEDNWTDFEPFLPNKEFITQRIRELNVSRRIVAHCNPLSRHDRQRLEVYFRDWENHLAGIGDSLP